MKRLLFLLAIALAIPTRADAAGRSRFQVRTTRTVRGTSLRPSLPRSRLRARAGLRLRVLQRRTDKSIASVKAAIATVSAAIMQLERQNQVKQASAERVANLVRQRQATLVRQRNGKGFVTFLGALVTAAAAGPAAPLVLAGAVLTARDAVRVQQLAPKVTALDREKATIDAKIAAHRRLKTRLEGDLTVLQTHEARIATALQELGRDMVRGHSLETSRTRLRHSQDLLANVQGQLNILKGIEKSASDIGLALDLHLGTARQHLVYAEKLVADSTRDYIDLVAVVLSKSPAVAAGNLLEGFVVDRASDLLREAGLGKTAARLLAKAVVSRVRRPAADIEARLAAALEAAL